MGDGRTRRCYKEASEGGCSWSGRRWVRGYIFEGWSVEGDNVDQDELATTNRLRAEDLICMHAMEQDDQSRSTMRKDTEEGNCDSRGLFRAWSMYKVLENKAQC